MIYFITFLNISQFYEVVTMVSQKDPVTRKTLRAPNGKVIRKPKGIYIQNGEIKMEFESRY